MDGQVFEMKDFETGVTAPPFHVNCRSTTAPYFDDEFAKGERAARGADGETYFVPSDMTYKEWKELQENDVKDKTIDIPNGYDVSKHSKEVKNANIISKELGGNIQMLNERVDQKTADMLWNDKLWEIKNVSSRSSIDHAIRNGLKQIIDNQGGIILNIDNSKLELDEIKNVIQKRFNRAGKEYKNLNVILVKNDKILENMTIEKEAFPSAKRGTSSASYNSNSIINIAKSQLKNNEKGGKIFDKADNDNSLSKSLKKDAFPSTQIGKNSTPTIKDNITNFLKNQVKEMEENDIIYEEYRSNKNIIDEKLKRIEIAKVGLDHEVGTVMNRKGNIVSEVVGTSNEVIVNNKILKNNIFTHNHPNGTVFSDDDINSMVNANALEIRVSTSAKQYYSLIRKKTIEKNIDLYNEFVTEYSKAVSAKKQCELVTEYLKNGIIDKITDITYRDAYNELGIKFLNENADKYGFMFSMGDYV